MYAGTMEIITRQEAIDAGLKKYFTGNPCKRGHVSERYVSSAGCCECDAARYAANPKVVQERSRKWRVANPEASRESTRKSRAANPGLHREQNRKWRAANIEASRESTRKWQIANPEAVREKSRKWAAANPEASREINRKYRAANLEARRDGYHKWYVANIGYVNEKTRRRNAAQLQRTPPWFDAAKVLPIYELAAELTKQTGVPHHVDHVLPLRGRLVSGLHVAENLQVLTGSDNCKKKNKFEVT